MTNDAGSRGHFVMQNTLQYSHTTICLFVQHNEAGFLWNIPEKCPKTVKRCTHKPQKKEDNPEISSCPLFSGFLVRSGVKSHFPKDIF